MRLADYRNRLVQLLRENARAHLPEFDADNWNARELIYKGHPRIITTTTNGPHEFGRCTVILDPKRRLCYDADLEITHQRERTGTRVADFIEHTLRKSGIEKIVINHNGAPGFWKKRKYEPIPQWMQHYLYFTKGISFEQKPGVPVQKRLH